MRRCEMRAMLDGRIHKDDISGLCSLMQGTENGRMKEMLYGLALDDDARVAANALWVLTHFPKADNEWLDSKRDGLTDRAMVVEDATGRRLLLTLLNRLEFTKDGIRADFLDFCLSRLTLASESPGVRSLCMKLAYSMCRHYPELLDELCATIDMMPGSSTPAIKAVRKNILNKIRR